MRYRENREFIGLILWYYKIISAIEVNNFQIYVPDAFECDIIPLPPTLLAVDAVLAELLTGLKLVAAVSGS